uniref:Uncharacterized protein n=1 Tax=Lepeophtheirus salmonis TaxID=72036 RepID=A0A0K2TJ24_LEPSM
MGASGENLESPAKKNKQNDSYLSMWRYVKDLVKTSCVRPHQQLLSTAPKTDWVKRGRNC